MNANCNILFYSQQCQYCYQLLNLMKAENLLCYFEMFCIDNKPMSQIPPNIKTVPTMIVKNINKPLVAQETFDYINSLKQIKNQKMMELKQQMKSRDPHGYSHSEMSVLSDPFAYHDNDNAMKQNYFGINEDKKNAIFTAPEQPKIRKVDQKKLISKLESTRTEEDSSFFDRMREERMVAYYRNNDNNK